jgi:hypothetical protein
VQFQDTIRGDEHGACHSHTTSSHQPIGDESTAYIALFNLLSIYKAAKTRSGVIGIWVMRAPVASLMALAMAAATGMTGYLSLAFPLARGFLFTLAFFLSHASNSWKEFSAHQVAFF